MEKIIVVINFRAQSRLNKGRSLSPPLPSARRTGAALGRSAWAQRMDAAPPLVQSAADFAAAHMREAAEFPLRAGVFQLLCRSVTNHNTTSRRDRQHDVPGWFLSSFKLKAEQKTNLLKIDQTPFG